MKKYKVLFCDLDGTLIKTKSGAIFPKGVWDMKLRFEVLAAIRALKPEYVFIVSNQGGIINGFVNERNFQFKCEYLRRAICEYVGIDINHCDYQYCPDVDKNSQYRKPNIGMLRRLCEQYIQSQIPLPKISNDDCLMIGDASGKEGQFSDTDKRTAKNFGIDYLDVDDFVREMHTKE